MAKTKQWAALTAVLVLLILAAGWFLLVSPKRSATTALNATAAKQEQDNATVRTQIAALKAQALDLPKKQARLTEISARMPDNPALPSLIRALSDAADKANVDLMSLSPSAPVALTAAVPATVGLATPPVAVQQIPLALTVQGKFFQMEQFLSNLESLPRAFVVTTLGVAPAGGSGPAAAAPAGARTAPAPTTPLRAGKRQPTMSHPSFPFESSEPDDPIGAESSEPVKPAADRRRLALIVAAAGALALLLALGAKMFLFSGGDTPKVAAAPVPKPKPAASAPVVPKPAVVIPAPETVPSTFSDVVGRDPFTALYVAPAAASGTSTGTPATGTSPTGPAATTSAGKRVSLVHAFTKDGVQYAQTKVDATVFTPAVDDTFATTFKLVSVKSTCASYLNGDESFSLCEGQEVLK